MTIHITCLPGDGIGPEVMAKVVYRALVEKLDVEFDIIESALAEDGTLSKELLSSLEGTRLLLKGPTTTQEGAGRTSVNVELRQLFDTYASVRPIKSDPLWPGVAQDVDMVIIREATEDLYVGDEYWEGPDIVKAVKTTTRAACERIARFSFKYARKNGRSKVTCVTKSNILKLTDGMLREMFFLVAQDFPEIKAEHMLVDNCAHQMVMNPHQFDVIVTSNLYGDILSDLGAGLVGGLGVVPGALFGDKYSIFEAVHGTAPDIIGKNIANPTALWKSFLMLLEHVRNIR